MEKKGNYTETYKTRSGKLDNQTKVALLEYLTESDEFHKLVCDITGTERKQVKVSPELEKLKDGYSHVCDKYKQERQKSNDLLHKWKEETAKRLDAEKEREYMEKRHNHLINEIFSILKEVKCSSVRDVVDQLKAERENGKLFAEQCELLKKRNDTLEKSCIELEEKFDRLSRSYNNVCNETKKIEKNRDNLSDNYDRLSKDYEYLNKCAQNQANTITRYIKENKRLIDKVEKLKGKLDRASKRYGELIKIICDKAIK